MRMAKGGSVGKWPEQKIVEEILEAGLCSGDRAAHDDDCRWWMGGLVRYSDGRHGRGRGSGWKGSEELGMPDQGVSQNYG